MWGTKEMCVLLILAPLHWFVLVNLYTPNIETGDKLKEKPVSVMLLHFADMVCVLFPLNRSVTTIQYKVFLTDPLYPMMKHFGLFQDDDVSIHRAQELSEWFVENENNVKS